MNSPVNDYGHIFVSEYLGLNSDRLPELIGITGMNWNYENQAGGFYEVEIQAMFNFPPEFSYLNPAFVTDYLKLTHKHIPDLQGIREFRIEQDVNSPASYHKLIMTMNFVRLPFLCDHLLQYDHG